MRRTASSLLVASLLFTAACTSTAPGMNIDPNNPSSDAMSDAQTSGVGRGAWNVSDLILQTATTVEAGKFGGGVEYVRPTVTINAAVGSDFSTNEVKNIAEMTEAYGITLSAEERARLASQKFLIKRLGETSIQPELTSEHGREFLGLYNAVAGDDPKKRTQANTVFWTADIFFHSYNLLATEILKEMENTVFAPAMRTLSKTFFEEASKKLASAKSDAEKNKWMKVRNFFAVPYALLANAIPTLTAEDYMNASFDAGDVKAEFEKADKEADTEKQAIAFVKNLKLDSESEKTVLVDVHQIFAAADKGIPEVFKKEFEEYKEKTNIGFQVDFTQFTPRSHYTSSSLRRQYFRAMNWYIQIPFFVGSDALTEYAFAASQLFAEQPQHLKSYSLLESTVNFLVGASDDLMPTDYLQALEETKGQSDQAAAIREYLIKAKQPKIKSLAAEYRAVGEDSGEVTALTKGMRIFSGKFILDSYWTDFLTQGDEKPLPGYTQKLPPMASSLEVMALLGSDYARGKIPTLDFYNAQNSKAIDKAMADLTKETATMTEQDWQENAYTTSLWSLKGLFDWEKRNRSQLPRFMQNDAWDAKTLMTAAGFWTELRHLVLLYAKQSFAERGGGGGCDPRKVPEPPKGYIEPQLLAYHRLQYLSKRLKQGLQDLGFTLQNFGPLDEYSSLMDDVITYTGKELQNTKFAESVIEHRDPDIQQPGGICVWYEITESDWEDLRRGFVNRLDMALPVPVEGQVLNTKDRRAAVVADVHTGGDSAFPPRILYQGTGVPHVILAAVKDANGPRLSIGFTYAHYEFTEPYGGQRMTDEKWQEKFYDNTEELAPFDYTDLPTWPKPNSWYAPILQTR